MTANNKQTIHIPALRKKTLDRKEAAAYLGVCVMTVDRALAKGEIQHYRLGRRILFDPEKHLDAYLQRHEVLSSGSMGSLGDVVERLGKEMDDLKPGELFVSTNDK